ncbi:serine/threonine-protein kinase [Nannocystis sp. ILAH1]|uniref:serine/threonine-protein kinase n=1 Tax=Nannocystis sp. ILAH1 TaxID=2996789 RepID=UPI00226F22AB|nr:serine/threonine-protein kinase [Nannocystis sp. ILAH1]MCY0994887.1 serine/threonine-protein kinase [Nannocystis sp. ILAH1]
MRTHVDRCEACRGLLAALVGRSSEASRGGDAALPAPALLAPGTDVGPYQVLERIGSGGMGVVYAAFDPRLDRKVALKLIRPELSTLDPDLERRLIRESKAMARLSHPNVLAVHDIGVCGGQVYMAMDLVEGQTLRAWLKTRPRWFEVLAVFVQAGRGLAAAHQAGLVHRDFKPDNVLVDRNGRVMVTDFGLARPIEASPPPTVVSAPTREAAGDEETVGSVDSAADTALTRTGALVGTPAYMAPEQQRGEAADERSDVFSFCVALHEGLYGARPLAGRPPAHPQAHPPGRDARVPGWLRRAVLRGLEPVPARRHPSMSALLAELSPPRPVALYLSLGTGVLAAAVALTAAAVGGGTDEHARVCAGAELHLASAWSDERRAAVRAALLVDDSARVQFVWRRVEGALDGHIAMWQRVHGELCEVDRDSAAGAAGARCLDAWANDLAAVTTVLSRGTGDDPDRALRVIDTLRAADTCLRPAPGQDRLPVPEDAASRTEVEAIRAALAEVEVLQTAGALAEARDRARSLVRRAEALAYRPVAAEALLLQGILEAEGADPHLGAQIVRRAANDAEAVRHDRVAAEAWSFLVFHAAQRLGDLERAREYAEQADAAIERLGGDLDLTSRVTYYRGMLAWRAGDPAAARAWYERAALQMREAGREPHIDLLEGLGLAYIDEGRFTAAAEQLERVLELRSEQLGPEHPDLGLARLNIAAALHELARDEEALVHLRAALSSHTAGHGHGPVELGRLHFDLGEVLRALGRYEEALVHNSRALAILREALGEEHPEVANFSEHRAGLYLGMGRPEEAVALMRETLAMHRRTRGERDPFVARCQLNLGEVLRRTGRPQEALELGRAALSLFEALRPESGAILGYVRTSVGRTLIALGREREALPLLDSALAGYPEVDVHPYQVASTRAALAQALWAAEGDRRRARDLAVAAREVLARGGPEWTTEREEIERWLVERPATDVPVESP